MLRHALFVLAVCLGAPVLAAVPPAALFFDNPSFSAPVLSPDAKWLAMRVGGNGQRDRLAVIELETNAAKVVASFRDIDIGNVRWVNDQRLVFDTVDRSAAPGDVNHGPGLYAVNRDASGFRQLVSLRNNLVSSGLSARTLLSPYTKLLPQAGKQDAEFVYVTVPAFGKFPNVEYVDLLRLNTLNGRSTTVARQGPVQTWMLDHQGEPRLTVSVDGKAGIQTTSYLDPASGAWRVLQTSKLVAPDAFTPLGFGPDGALYVRTNKGGDLAAIHTYDLKNNTISEQPLVSVQGYDFAGALIHDRKALLGVRYTADVAGTHWFDPAMNAIQKAVDAQLPDTVNLISVAPRAEAPVVLVVSFSDVSPSSYRLFDHQAGTLRVVGHSRPMIDPRQMGRQAMMHYTARDGLEIPAYLTMPPGSANTKLPLVVLVHGGPYVRGNTWGWKADTQFLVSRGYAVLEPEYRGSTGFGEKHYRAGWKQWGLAMQNDIADGAKWAIAQGVADPARICIAGASYGGYATLMGLINDPELFKCGVAWAGVTDIALLYSGHWSFESDMRETYKQHGFPVLVGDPVADAVQLKATSPLAQAARLKQPLLLAHGSADRRVPLYHGTRFRDAVKATNDQVEWIQYDEEGHGWTLPKNRIDFWTRVEKFLERQIGKP